MDLRYHGLSEQPILNLVPGSVPFNEIHSDASTRSHEEWRPFTYTAVLCLRDSGLGENKFSSGFRNLNRRPWDQPVQRYVSRKIWLFGSHLSSRDERYFIHPPWEGIAVPVFKLFIYIVSGSSSPGRISFLSMQICRSKSHSRGFPLPVQS